MATRACHRLRTSSWIDIRRQRKYQNSTTQVLDAGHGIASPSYVEADVRWSRECRMPEADGSLSFYFFDVDDNLLSFP